MSFKPETKTVPLIEDNLKYQFKQLQVLYLEFMKVYEDLSNYDQKLINVTRKDYDKIKDDMYNNLKQTFEDNKITRKIKIDGSNRGLFKIS